MKKAHISVYQFANNGTQYIDIDRKQCLVRTFDNSTWLPWFAWTKNSTNGGFFLLFFFQFFKFFTLKKGPCSYNFNNGTLWIGKPVDGTNIHMCANKDTPLDLFIENQTDKIKEIVSFELFKPRNPNLRFFQLPERCWSLKPPQRN
jgi:hypothetical protein